MVTRSQLVAHRLIDLRGYCLIVSEGRRVNRIEVVQVGIGQHALRNMLVRNPRMTRTPVVNKQLLAGLPVRPLSTPARREVSMFARELIMRGNAVGLSYAMRRLRGRILGFLVGTELGLSLVVVP